MRVFFSDGTPDIHLWTPTVSGEYMYIDSGHPEEARRQVMSSHTHTASWPEQRSMTHAEWLDACAQYAADFFEANVESFGQIFTWNWEKRHDA